VALATAQKPPAPAQFERIAALSLGALLLVGMLTYLRMLQRNAVTDEFKATLRAIRDRYVAQAGGSGGSDYGVPVQRRKPAKWLRGGYAETVGTANGVLLLALLVLRGAHPLLALLLGAALAADLWRLAVLRRT
jgi:hypothetical protein